MFELRPASELFPRFEVEEPENILVIDGPNPVEGFAKAQMKGHAELPAIKKESFKTIIAWLIEPDEKKGKEIVEQSSRIVTPGGSVWIVIPKKISVEHKKATGIDKDKAVSWSKSRGLILKKTLGIGPHHFALRMFKHGK